VYSVLYLEFIADLNPDPAFHSNADLDPASKNISDSDPDPKPCHVGVFVSGTTSPRLVLYLHD
jgi:hypothetical protein